MSIILWGILALVAGLLALWFVGRLARPSGPPLPPDAELSATPLQRIAWWSIGLGGLFTAAAVVLVLAKGAEATYESDALRITFTLLLLAVIGVVSMTAFWARAHVRREDGSLDERDKAILGRAPAVQAGAMLVTLAIWTVGLTEHFHEAGAVPLFYLYLVFWSCVVVDLLGLPVGVLLGYRKG